MPARGARNLDELRREIDRIDDRLHDLLMQRTAIVEEVSRAKNGARAEGRVQFFRPGREASVLRRLVGRHRGPFPAASLVRVWREIMSGQLRVQTEIAVAVHAPDRAARRWDLARDQFGAGARYRRFARPQQVVAAVRSGEAAIGVLAPPGAEAEDGEEPWWPLLADDAPDTPRIFSRLPLIAAPDHAPGRDGAAALAIAFGEPDSSGRDFGCLVAECAAPTDAAALAAAAGLPLRPVAAAAGGRLHLFETDGLLRADDPRLSAAMPGARLLPVGGYAAPLETGAFRETAYA